MSRSSNKVDLPEVTELLHEIAVKFRKACRDQKVSYNEPDSPEDVAELPQILHEIANHFRKDLHELERKKQNTRNIGTSQH